MLIRFVDNLEYAEQFLSGEIYMNSIGFFWENGFEDQKDSYEGISHIVNKDSVNEIPQDLLDVLCYDLSIKSNAFRFANICSFYRLSIDKEKKLIELPSSKIDLFGSYSVLISNREQFINRVLKAVKINPDYDVIMGDIRYHKRKVKSDLEFINHSIDIQLQSIDREEFLKNNKISGIRDCFDKLNKFSYQNEWRICLSRNIKNTNHYILNIGDISDIAHIVPTSKLRESVLIKYENYKLASFNPQTKGFQGTSTRKKFKEAILKMDNEIHVIATIG